MILDFIFSTLNKIVPFHVPSRVPSFHLFYWKMSKKVLIKSESDSDDEYMYLRVKKPKKKHDTGEYMKGLPETLKKQGYHVETGYTVELEISKQDNLLKTWKTYFWISFVITILVFLGCCFFGVYSVVFRKPFVYISQVQLTSLGGGRTAPGNQTLGINVSLGCDNQNYLPLYLTRLNLVVTIISSTDSTSYEFDKDPISNITMIDTTMNPLWSTDFVVPKRIDLGSLYARIRQLFLLMSFEFKLSGKIYYEILKIPFEEELHFHQKLYPVR